MSVIEWVVGGVVVVGAALWRWRGPIGRLLAGGPSGGVSADALADLIRAILAEIEAKRIESVKADVEAVIRERLEPVTKDFVLKNPDGGPSVPKG